MEKRDRPELGNSLIAVMDGVRGDERDYPIELRRNGDTGRLVVRAYNEAGYSYTEIDLWDLVHWLQSGPGKELVSADVAGCGTAGDYSH